MTRSLVLALVLCTISTPTFAGSILSLIYDSSTVVTLPSTEILNARINDQQQRLTVTPDVLVAMNFVETFAGKTLTTHQLSKQLNTLYWAQFQAVKKSLPAQQHTNLSQAWEEQKKDIFPELYRLLLADQKDALNEFIK